MTTYTVFNDFHNTECRINVAPHRICHGFPITIRPTDYQLRRLRRELCGIDGCTCGGWRGPQADESDTPFEICDN